MLALALLILSPGVSEAQPLSTQGLGDLNPILFSRGGDWTTRFDFSGAVYRRANIKGSSNNLALDRYGAHLKVQREFESTGALTLGLDYERMAYSSSYELASVTAPIESADFWRLGATWSGSEASTFPWFAGVRAESGVVHGVDPWDEFTFGAKAGVSLPLTSNAKLRLALDINERHEDEARYLPLAFIDWQISEDWSLGDQAGGYGLGFQHDPETRYFLTLNLEERGYRLAKDGPTGGSSIYDEELSLRLGMAWEPNPSVKMDFFMGLANREVEMRSDGVFEGRIETDEGIFGGIRLSFAGAYLR
jgi:outer membrane receptor protein involved in Fe transport